MRGISCFFAASLLWAASAREEGIAAFEAGRYSVALAKLKEAAKDSHDARARMFLALTQAAMGDCRTALPNLPATDRLAGLAAAKCYAVIGDEGKAFTTLEELRKRFPNDADVLYLRARLHMKAFNDATLAMFQGAPASYRVHELSAEVLEVQNRYSEAAAEYRKAIELNPAAPDLHYRLGRAILLESHNPEALERAAAEFRAELKLSPEDAACEFQLGQIAQVAGKQAEAKPHFERAVALSPGFVQALIALAKLEPAEKAIPLLKKAVELQPSNEGAHYALLTAYRNAGDMEKAAAEKAILDKLQKPAGGEFSEFLKKLGEKPAKQ
ncbi:MAG TPA: tetratricopeptide repeat protein [Bryobacteraceae bacterium]